MAQTPASQNFRNIDKEAAQRAQTALAGGNRDPLTVPADARVSNDEKGNTYSRWTESVTIIKAYRSVTKKGLMDVITDVKIRQSSEKKNNGRRVFGHWYFNTSRGEVSEGHVKMNERTEGAMLSALVAAGIMKETGEVSASVLDRMWPSQNKPGANSPLNGKSVVAQLVQTLKQATDLKTGKLKFDEDGNPIMERRDNIESFLPEEDEVEAAEVEASEDPEGEE